MKKKVVIACVALLALGVIAFVLYPDTRDEAQGLASALIQDVGQATIPPVDTGDLTELPISSDNTTVSFSCAKTVAGKTLVVRGGWSGKFNSMIEGVIGLDPQTHQPRTLQARVRIDSLWSEHDQLTEALLTTGFFRPEEHPWAVFAGALAIKDTEHSADEHNEENYVVSGNFELNGITKHIEFPVDLIRTGGVLWLTSTFSLDRRAFDVKFKEEGAFGLLLTDGDIADRVAIKLQIELSAAWNEALVAMSDVVGTEVSAGPSATSDAAADLPESFTETIPSTQVRFGMVLIPADPATGMEAFYLGRHEVTWDEFMPWVQGNDLADESLVGEERAMKLRPSSPYGTVDRNFGMYHRPALGMSRLSAELYCKWLSEQTGRTYRLPTEAEWQWAYKAGGGDPAKALSAEEAERVATYKENAWDDSIGDWATTKVGQREPDALGVYDLAGNVAEWVADTADERVVRGGHFESPLSELGVGRAIEDMDAWNRDYPNEPKSPWWYVNARWVGFRVVCEAAAVGATEP